MYSFNFLYKYLIGSVLSVILLIQINIYFAIIKKKKKKKM